MKLALSRLEQPLNNCEDTDLTPSNDTDANFEHPENEPLPIDVTLFALLIVVNDVHPVNKPSGIEVALVKLTVTIFVQSFKEFAPNV